MSKETIGFYGGKFLPMHKGHLYCIDVASQKCDHVHVIMFINGNEEEEVRSKMDTPDLDVGARLKQVERVCALYPNIDFHVIDCKTLRLPNGDEDWDAETPLVRAYVPHMDYVFSSELRYDDYFKHAYPEAEHIIVDAERKKYPISSTMIRAMKTLKEKEEWTV